jgi:hypothetical protein
MTMIYLTAAIAKRSVRAEFPLIAAPQIYGCTSVIVTAF